MDDRFIIGSSFENSSISDLTWITNEIITESLLMSSTVQGHQIPSLSTLSALKPTVCGSDIVFSVNVGSAYEIKTGLRSTKADNLFDVSAFRC